MTTLNDAFETELPQEDGGYESGIEIFNILTPLSRALGIYHVSTREDLSFSPAHFGQSPTTPMQHEEISPHRYRCHSFTHHELVFTSSDDESPVRPQHSNTNASSQPAGVQLPHHQSIITSTTYTHKIQSSSTQILRMLHGIMIHLSTEEYLPTAPLEDDIWSKDPILDRPLCTHKRPHEPNLQCSYPCPYSNTSFRIDLPQSTPQNATMLNYEQMDFIDISSDFPDIMTTTSDDDIPDLVDISDFLDNMQHKA